MDPNLEQILDSLACPRCDRPLKPIGEVLHCKGCTVDFPVFDSIPWLFSEPNAALSEWRSRYQLAAQQARQDAERARAEADEATRSTTEKRLRLWADARSAYADELEQLLAPLGHSAADTPIETHLALKTRLPPAQGIDSYHANIHRDWMWGDEENSQSCAMVLAALGEPASVLVLGCGAGRLAYDLHRARPGQQTFALDINPLLIFIAASISAGDSVELHEFPLAPKSLGDVALTRRLPGSAAAVPPAAPGLHWLLGDALRAPFQAASFDAVVTPWFVDIIDQDLAVTAARVNHLLRPGGRWVSFGSLAFGSARLAERYSLEEIAEVISDVGFSSPAIAEATLPYLASPVSRHSRREQVISMSATKIEEIKPPPRHSALPEWIIKSNQPVPALPSFQTQALSTQIYAFVMSLIDGKRTIAEMAAMMEEQRLMPKADADAAIRGFLITMYEESES